MVHAFFNEVANCRKHTGMTQGLITFCVSWVVVGAVVKVLAVVVLDSDVSFLSANQNKNQNV